MSPEPLPALGETGMGQEEQRENKAMPCLGPRAHATLRRIKLKQKSLWISPSPCFPQTTLRLVVSQAASQARALVQWIKDTCLA